MIYNFIGPVYAGANRALLIDVLRGEWGFRSMAETDYDGSYGFMITDNVIRNGGNLKWKQEAPQINRLKGGRRVLAGGDDRTRYMER